MVVNKDYKYYKGEEKNPYEFGSDQAYFFSQEERHAFMSEADPEHLKILKKTLESDFTDLKKRYGDTTAWEVVCLCIEDAYECGYDFENNIKRAARYGDS